MERKRETRERDYHNLWLVFPLKNHLSPISNLSHEPLIFNLHLSVRRYGYRYAINHVTVAKTPARRPLVRALPPRLLFSLVIGALGISVC